MPDGEQACQALEEGHWSLVILDMHLGKLSGLDVLKRARALPAHATTPIVAISADDTLRKQAHAAGADLWITKPVDISRLSQFINIRLGFV
jgi:DNA-binding response OmpR family regulator